MGILASAVAALSTFYQASEDPHDPDDVEISSIRLIAKMPTIAAVRLQEVDRPAVRLPGQQPRLREQLPADDVRRPGRAVRRRSRRRPGPARPPHPPRRPRAELLDLDRSPRRLEPRQPLRLDLGRHRRPLGSPPRRRQPGGPRDAPGDRRRRRRRLEGRRSGEGQERPVPPHGLRSSGLQELRPAGQDHQGGGGHDPGQGGASTTGSSTSPGSSKRSPSATLLHRPQALSRTSTSTAG